MIENTPIKKARDLSLKIRIHCLAMTSDAGSSHIGSIFSCADIIACLYSGILRYDTTDPKSNNRDRFILSKGHSGAALYATLAEVGFFDLSVLKSYYKNGSHLSGHVSHKNVPGVDFSTGSLGHGLPVACGIALAGKLDNKNFKVVTLLGDGECNEGAIWEAAMFANHKNLGNLIVIIDRNNLQSIENTEQTLALEPFISKWENFGFDVFCSDGHSHSELFYILQKIWSKTINEKPSVLIAKTIKGKGVSFMENSVLWHYRAARGDEFLQAMQELESQKS